MSLILRQCVQQDHFIAVPLMYSAGPSSFDYVFAQQSTKQVNEFLTYAFVKKCGEFGANYHYMIENNGESIGVLGVREHKDNIRFTLSAVKRIFGFYGFLNGLKVMVRGLKFESLVKPTVKGTITLHNFAIAPDAQGKGFAKQAIAQFELLAKSKGYACIALDVAQKNCRARALYFGLGFKEVAVHKGAFQSKYASVGNHIYMEKSI